MEVPADDFDAPGGVNEDPEGQPRYACAGEHGEVAVVGAAQQSFPCGPLVAVVVSEVDAESLAGPEVMAVDRVIDDNLQPAMPPLIDTIVVSFVDIAIDAQDVVS